MADSNERTAVLIVGSAGAFGSRIVELLSRLKDVHLLLGGRTQAPLELQLAEVAARGGSARVAVLDANQINADDLRGLGAHIVINTAGPFQGQSYQLASAAIAARCHYIDLSDSRDFVCGFPALNDKARAAGVLAISGASSVPGISSAVVLEHRELFKHVHEIDIAISPGNSFDPGLATVEAVLDGVGQPLDMLTGGRQQTVYGWHGLRRHAFGPVGRRWVGYVDVPDLELFPSHDADLERVRFQAGLEVGLFHLGLWGASWLVRGGLVRSLKPLAGPLLALKRRLSFLGSDTGGMTVALRGLDHDDRPKSVIWTLVARSGHGPYVPALASVALARRIIAGHDARLGAWPCFGMIGLADILAEARGLDIQCTTQETAPSS